MKKVLITGGPTNEYIDEVMKITNMSTGSLAVKLAGIFIEYGYFISLVINNSVNVEAGLKGIREPLDDRLKITRVETTDEMLSAIFEESKENDFDAVIHAAAVGDYKGDFSFRMEDLAEELFQKRDSLKSPDDILAVLTNPDCKLDDSSKISSYQPNLTVKLGLTPKIIARLREWFPDALLIGCKLLENVSQDELINTAKELCEKNEMDYILANDLAKLRNGDAARYPVDNSGYIGHALKDETEIFKFVNINLKY